jgi:hypothetical protein
MCPGGAAQRHRIGLKNRGSLVRISIETEHRQDVLCLPTESLSNLLFRELVFVIHFLARHCDTLRWPETAATHCDVSFAKTRAATSPAGVVCLPLQVTKDDVDEIQTMKGGGGGVIQPRRKANKTIHNMCSKNRQGKMRTGHGPCKQGCQIFLGT